MSLASRYLDKNPLVAMHVRHDKAQILEVCFIPLSDSFTKNESVPSLHMRIIPIQEPRGFSGVRTMTMREVGGEFSYRKWGGIDQVESRTLFENWVTGVLRMNEYRRILPVCFGWYRYAHLLEDWLGCSFDDLIHTSVRDIESIYSFFLDRTNAWGGYSTGARPTFPSALKYFCVDCLDPNSIPLVTLSIAEMYRAAIFKMAI